MSVLRSGKGGDVDEVWRREGEVAQDMDGRREKHGNNGRELFSSGTWTSAVAGSRFRRNVGSSGTYQHNHHLW